MISKFFIPRPIFACVVSLIIILVGTISIMVLPVAQYPELTPPQVSVSTSYPGASPGVIADTVASPLEDAINGVDYMIYMNSTSSGNGSMNISISFEVGTDPDMNTINVNNRVQNVISTLPAMVQKLGVTVTKRSTSILQVMTMHSSDGRYDSLYMSNYALVNIIDELKRLPGIGDASVMGGREYSMRLWLDPQKMTQMNVTTQDIANVVNEQNSQYSAGRLGDMPLAKQVDMNYLLVPPGRLVTVEEFQSIIIRAKEDGSWLRLSDVARVEMGAYDYSGTSFFNGKPAVTIATYTLPGANALAAADALNTAMERLKAEFPEGMECTVVYDTTTFVRISIEEVVHTLFEAMFLVFLVVFLFLQNWRATLIPCLAVPVSIVGTFAGMYAMGFSINTLTMFGMVLAIGIVVDDAIIVLEAVERIMEEENLPPREATFKAMEEMSSPIIAIVLVLCAVFLPVSFLGGMTGEMYRQFAVTISISVVLSGVVALTLTPALCALLLKPGKKVPIKPFRIFNDFFDKATHKYSRAVTKIIKHSVFAIILFGVLCLSIGGMLKIVPAGLVPDEDQGIVMAGAMLPDGSNLQRTEIASGKSDKMIMDNFPYVKAIATVAGVDLLSDFSNKPNASISFMAMKSWDDRDLVDQSSFALVEGIRQKGMAAVPEAFVFAFNPPPIVGMSNTGGFEMYLQSKGGGSPTALSEMAQKLVAKAAGRPELANVSNSFTTSFPQMSVELDRVKARALQVPVDEIFSTMGATFGSTYINDFTLYNRNFKVVMQSDGDFRSHAEDLGKVTVRSRTGDMIPLNSLVTLKNINGPEVVQRFNLFPAAKITGNPADGYSLGQAMAVMEELVQNELTEDYGAAWTGSAYQQMQVSSSSTIAFAMAFIMVFLILAAQYEKWSLPIAVLLAVPFAVFGALVSVLLRGLPNDVYFQIALVMLIGLAAKNAILIVEFAVLQREAGKSLFDAAVEAAHLRFRPIIMTSLAFIFGCMPLAISSGAGSASRHSLGTAVVGGMTSATFLALFFIPMFYYVVMKISERAKGGKDAAVNTINAKEDKHEA